MLTESQVIGAVCKHLTIEGWTVESTCAETERGVDIVASLGKKRLAVEAKGETSSKSHTNRHGKPFNSGQVNAHVSRALFAAAKQFGSGSSSAIALPRNALHLKSVSQIRNALERLNVEVFWVDADLTVRLEGTGK